MHTYLCDSSLLEVPKPFESLANLDFPHLQLQGGETKVKFNATKSYNVQGGAYVPIVQNRKYQIMDGSMLLG